eukprot:TRINITY_DN4743_c0_g1_i1.p1 TRINITY_DN4743_c0_g1~~TRINITY_DN4743_c0_g1_i1.p1  ORF type:complete len:456 (-),score=42.02 TRINITY_DN4743_c0_g1_i1:25-1392(-)
MAISSRIDFIPYKHLVIATVLSCIGFLLLLVFSFSAPPLHESNRFSSYNCSDGSHTWDPSKCNGIQLNTGVWSDYMEIQTNNLNKEWFTVVRPYTTQSKAFLKKIRINTVLEGKKHPNSKKWYIVSNFTEDSLIACYGVDQCPSFILVFEDTITYSNYRVKAQFLTTMGTPLNIITDVEFDMIKDSPAFTKLELVMKLILLIISVILMSYHMITIQDKIVMWEICNWDQRALSLLMFALIFFNNPFYPLEFLVTGWFLQFIDNLFEIVFTVAMFFYWYQMALRMRKERDPLYDNSTLRFSFYGLVATYGILATVLYAVGSIRNEMSPVYGIPDHMTFMQILYYMTGAIFLSIVVCIFILLTFAFPIIMERPIIRPRFMFFTIPTLIIVTSYLFSMFQGSFGPLGRSGPLFIFYTFGYNLYLWIIVWAFWPIEKGFGGVSEHSPIIGDTTGPVIDE